MQSTTSKYLLTLFVTGATLRSARAIANVHAFCEKELVDDYALEVVDLYRTPQRALTDQVVAAPTLVRNSPAPQRRVIGDMSNRARLNSVIKVT